MDNNQFNNQPDMNFNDQPNNQFNNQPDMNVNNQPNNQFNNQPDMNVNNQPNNQFNNQPNMSFNNQPNNNGNKSNKNTLIIAVVVVVAIVVLLFALGVFGSGAKKTLNCTTHHSSYGMEYDETYIYYINDGSLSAKYIEKIDLSKAEADSYNDDTIDSVVSSVRSSCSSQTGCKFDYNYSKGKYLEIVLTLDEKYWESKGGSELKNKSADELYSTLKAGHTNGSVDGSYYTCK